MPIAAQKPIGSSVVDRSRNTVRVNGVGGITGAVRWQDDIALGVFPCRRIDSACVVQFSCMPDEAERCRLAAIRVVRSKRNRPEDSPTGHSRKSHRTASLCRSSEIKNLIATPLVVSNPGRTRSQRDLACVPPVNLLAVFWLQSCAVVTYVSCRTAPTHEQC